MHRRISRKKNLRDKRKIKTGIRIGVDQKKNKRIMIKENGKIKKKKVRMPLKKA